MNASCARDEGQVHPVVDDHEGIVASGVIDDGVAEVEEPVGGETLGPKLKTPRAAVQERAGQRGGFPASACGGLDIDNGVKPGNRDQAVSARSVFFCRGMKRSMNEVLSRPAWKSASLKILRCSGTEV